MKTPMQELFSKLEIEHPNLFNIYTTDGKNFINEYVKFIKMEKEQIINSYIEGRSKNNSEFFVNEFLENAEKYYIEKYKVAKED